MAHLKVNIWKLKIECISKSDNNDILNKSYFTNPAYEQWPTDEELKLIANYIDLESATRVSERLGMSDLSKSADEQQRYEALCAWRQSNKGEWTKMHGDLVSALKSTNISGKYVFDID